MVFVCMCWKNGRKNHDFLFIDYSICSQKLWFASLFILRFVLVEKAVVKEKQKKNYE